jgi:hypothetical protein
VVSVLFLSPASLAQNKKSKKSMPRGTPVLWRMPEDISARNLFWGPGGSRNRPNLSRVTFIEEEKGGYSKKYRVRDGAGRVWVAKVGKEAQSETAAVRLLWAVGYPTEINYLVPRVRIRGAGTFQNVRFEARPTNIKRLDEWKWKENPFVGTREFQGLKVLMLLLNNWDIKDTNNVIFHARGADGESELRYVISDLGATFGTTGDLPLFWRINRSRNNPEDYEEAKFIDDIEDDGRVDFAYRGKNRGLFDDIRVDEARWIGRLLAQLSDRQLRDAFRAANYSREEVEMLASAVRRRINELNRLDRAGR